MPDRRERLLRTSGLACFGAVAAGLSHELNNVFATINELAGLLDDLALAAGGGRPPDPERIRHIIGRVAVQVERGRRTSKQLNRFAHSADAPWGLVDAGSVVEEMVLLGERLARLGRVELRSSRCGETIALETDPFLLRHLLWRCLELMISATEPGGAVEVGVAATQDSDGARFTVISTSAAPGAELDAKVAMVSALAEALGGRVEHTAAAGSPPHLAVSLVGRPMADSPTPGDTNGGR